MNYKTKSEKETQEIAKKFSKTLHGGELILLYGDLGVGKSVFVRAMANVFGIKEKVKSPTFNLMKCYKIIKKQENKNIKIKNSERSNTKGQMLYFCHIDAYRLNYLDDLLDIGVEDYIGKENCITAIEWAERIKIQEYKNNQKSKVKNQELRSCFAIDNKNIKIIKIKIEYGKDENERMIEIKN